MQGPEDSGGGTSVDSGTGAAMGSGRHGDFTIQPRNSADSSAAAVAWDTSPPLRCPSSELGVSNLVSESAAQEVVTDPDCSMERGLDDSGDPSLGGYEETAAFLQQRRQRRCEEFDCGSGTRFSSIGGDGGGGFLGGTMVEGRRAARRCLSSCRASSNSSNI